MHEFEGEWKTRCGAPAKVISSGTLEYDNYGPAEEIYLGVLDLDDKIQVSTYWNKEGNNLFTKYDLVERVRDLRVVR